MKTHKNNSMVRKWTYYLLVENSAKGQYLLFSFSTKNARSKKTFKYCHNPVEEGDWEDFLENYEPRLNIEHGDGFIAFESEDGYVNRVTWFEAFPQS